MKAIYLDNAATTEMYPSVVQVMRRHLEGEYGNPSSLHSRGRGAKAAVESARGHFANLIGAERSQIVFTSSGTESVQQVLLGAFLANPKKRHMVTTAIEHHAVLQTCELLEELGVEVTYIPVGNDCSVNARAVLEAVRTDTLLVSVMAVNNETGAVQPIVELAQQIKTEHPEVLFHSDMVQALPVQEVNVAEIHMDFASFSSHKIHGPKGVGALYIRNDRTFKPIARGGNQERRRRGGTENVPGIAGFGEAARQLKAGRQREFQQMEQANLAFWDAIRKIPGVYRNSPESGAKSILNVGFRGVANDVLLMRLDLEGVEASAGSACTAGSLQPSHVLKACGFSEDVLRESVRFSFSGMTTTDEAREAAQVVQSVVDQLV
ncbi:cysteine desulfurase family protein [Alicyclobacillus sp. SO9]|uniref:cysteine desulfurase family protein n=1 Tax=Alicyclobacillus sp. SO9 TaxID=2665646 RepID=UPI0018E83CFF|nr:cysteine desulfurase family protein [Alicyclobacillus sp. SO9]QQE77373.1 cysteine desulfurase [Alicyclobacillus sp. SO9]